MLELYHHGMSVCAQKVRVVLAAKDIPYTGHVLDIRAGQTHTPTYRALNPHGVVPTLVVDGEPIIESTVICEYLDDAYPDTPLRPADAMGRAAVRQWTIRPDAGMHKAFGLLSFAVAFRHQNTSQQMATRKASESTVLLKSVIEHGLDSPEIALRIDVVEQMLADMAARLREHDWLVGDGITLADIAMLPYVCRLRDLGQAWLWEEGSAYADIAPWLDRCYAHPGYAGIADFLDAKYLGVMGQAGRDAEPKIAHDAGGVTRSDTISAGGVALVTGASRGIGRAIALALAAEGHEIAVHYGNNAEAALKTVALIEAAGGAAFSVAGDLRTIAGVDAIDRALGDRPIGILVNNAGWQLPEGPAADETTFDALFAVNVKAAYFLIQRLAPRIVDGGRIVNISSGTSIIGFPDKMVYAMAKAATNAMTLSFAKALGPRGITVNAVLPGIVETDMNPWVRHPEAAARVARMSALNRVAQPADIADIVVFLASPAARWITGELMNASGGTQLGGS